MAYDDMREFLAALEQQGNGLRDLVHLVATSAVFLTK